MGANIALVRFVAASILLAPVVSSLKLLCSKFDSSCRLENWNPKEEGYFVLKHIPPNWREVYLINPKIAILEMGFCQKMSAVSSTIELINATMLTTISYPQACNISLLDVESAKLTIITFEPNEHLNAFLVRGCLMKQLPPTLINLSNLQKVYYVSSSLEQIDLGMFCTLHLVVTLELIRSKIAQVVGRIDAACNTSMEHLNLSRNQLRTINLDLFAPFARLWELDLSHNKIESLGGRLQNTAMEYLNLSYNRIMVIDMCSWADLVSLDTFAVTHNKLGQVPQCSNKLWNATNIGFGHNQIEDPQIEQFTHFPRLQQLGYENNQISSIPLNESLYPASIRGLHLSDNPINNSSVPEGTFQRVMVGGLPTFPAENPSPANLSMPAAYRTRSDTNSGYD